MWQQGFGCDGPVGVLRGGMLFAAFNGDSMRCLPSWIVTSCEYVNRCYNPHCTGSFSNVRLSICADSLQRQTIGLYQHRRRRRVVSLTKHLVCVNTGCNMSADGGLGSFITIVGRVFKTRASVLELLRPTAHRQLKYLCLEQNDIGKAG